MDKDKARRILEQNKAIKSEIERLVEIDERQTKLNLHPGSSYLYPIVEKHARVIKYPLKSDTIGAVFCSIEDKKFIFINTNISRGEENFHLLHEYYHIQYGHSSALKYNNKYCEVLATEEFYNDNIEERKASLYAAMILVSRLKLQELYPVYKSKFGSNVRAIASYIMSSLSAPYTLTLMRLYEDNYITEEEFYNNIEITRAELELLFNTLSLDKAVLYPSRTTSYDEIKLLLQQVKKEDTISDFVLNYLKNEIDSIFVKMNGNTRGEE